VLPFPFPLFTSLLFHPPRPPHFLFLFYPSPCRLAAGPRNFVIIGEPEAARHVLKGYGDLYAKGLVAEVAEFLFGSGFAIAEGELWTVSGPCPCSPYASSHWQA